MRVTFAICCFVLPFIQPSSPPPAKAANEDAALRALVERFFDAYAQKDLDGFMALWSEKSQDYASRKQFMQQYFAANDFEFANLAVSKIKIEGDSSTSLKASLRASVEMSRTDLQTKQVSKEKMIRTLELVNEGDQWMVWRYYPAVNNLATRLIEAKSEDERQALLKEEKELVTAELLGPLYLSAQAQISGDKGSYAHALDMFRLAQSLAEQFGEQVDHEWRWAIPSGIGDVELLQGNYAQALASFQKSFDIAKATNHQWRMSYALVSKARDLLVLEYVVTDDQTYLFTFIGTGQLAVHAIKMKRKELKDRINALRAAIREKEGGTLGLLPRFANALQQVSSLLAPAATMIADAKQVCIIPDILWDVPFAALKTPNGQHLIEHCAVFYAPSLTALKAMTEKPQPIQPQTQLLALAPFAYSDKANPKATREVPLRVTFGALPATQREVTTVSQLYGVKPYMRETASETRFKTEAGKAHILHFATHGLFDPMHGMYSGVVLSLDEPSNHPSPITNHHSRVTQHQPEDGYLEAREVVDLEVNADLVVLSACETGRGQLSRGEGVIGMSWAFFVAGCPSTIVSQWKVADESTAQLMTEFYRNLKAGKSKAEALRLAQLSLIRSNPKSQIKNQKSKWDHPFY